MSTPLHIKNAAVWDGQQTRIRDLYVKKGQVVAEKPNHALEIDLNGYTIYPAFINAHDHLALNHYPRTKFRDIYENAHQWGEDVNLRLDDEPFKTLRSYPLWDRLFIGGRKNLLSGATLVVQHNPLHKQLRLNDFPVRVYTPYGWSHSLHFDSDEAIQQSYSRTPQDTLWFIHLAEGTDGIAANEYQRLQDLGCVSANTVLIHGVGLANENISAAVQHVRGLVWCPSTNEYLLGQTAKIQQWQMANKLLLGSDSRLTADGDLLDEMQATGLDLIASIPLVTEYAANLLNLPNRGHLNVGAVADFIVGVPQNRARLQLIVREGIPQIGAPELMSLFPKVQSVACQLDNSEKRIHVALARQVHRCKLKERGLMVDALPIKKRFWRI